MKNEESGRKVDERRDEIHDYVKEEEENLTDKLKSPSI